MANSEESSPLLLANNHNQEGDNNNEVDHTPIDHKEEEESKPTPTMKEAPSSVDVDVDVDDEKKEAMANWTADGLPLGHVTSQVIGEPAVALPPRGQWNSGLLSCLGRHDEFHSSDLEVCLLGSFAPCVLYGSNVERLGSGLGSFANSCLAYTGLYMLGNTLFGWNCLAPWFSYPSRSAIRRKFNLEGSCEAFARTCGCCSDMIEDEEMREQMETACDSVTHFFCHPCSLCQEARELRRRLPHPGFNGRSVLVMMPPIHQTMGQGGSA